MKNLWNGDYLPKDTVSPQHFIQKQCDYLRQKTNGKIIAKVVEQKKPSDKLVESDSPEKLNFEFFLSSKNTPNFRYRVLKLSHSIPIFPIKITVSLEIARELIVFQDPVPTFTGEKICQDQSEFEEYLEEILNSKVVTDVINSLLVFNIDDSEI
ncbi:MAG: hypothetical protein FWF85_02165 [Clostridiales bacterium]|jgi:hypothetical protein|nr:hypothetical protein [Clostridiales bacterium]MDR2713133.1 hypothetical protein [Clostridiales bacterium]